MSISEPVAAGVPAPPGGEGARVRPGQAAASGGARPSYLGIAAAALVLAGISLAVLPRGIAYDPWSWLVWGRQIVHGHLDTTGAATSIKPLPIVFTTGFALFGDKAEPLLWLLVARAGALAAVGLAYRLADRFAGPAAGVLAGLGVIAIHQFSGYLFFTGMSEPMAAATALLAADAAVARRHRLAFAALLLTGLLRIEVWPVAAGYALWRLWAAGRGRWPDRAILPHLVRRAAAAAAGLVLLPVAWFGLDWIGSGTPLRSTSAAATQSQGGPLLSAHPGLATFAETAGILPWSIGVAALLTWLWALAAVARRRGGPWQQAVVWLGAAAFTWLLVAAVMAQARVATGAPRYLIPAEAVAGVLGSAGLVRWARWWAAALRSRGRQPAIAAVVGAAVALGGGAAQFARTVHRSATEWPSDRQLQDIAQNMPAAVRIAGGPAALSRCGRIGTDPFQLPVLVWAAHLQFSQVDDAAPPRGTVLQVAGSPAVPASYRPVGSVGTGSSRIIVFTTCRHG